MNSSDLVELGLEREQKLPSESTIRRALQSLDPDDLNARLAFWMYRRTGTIERRTVIAVDGKTMRGASTDRPTVLEHATGAILVRRWVADRSIEIPALPELLKSFAPDGVVVTAEPREIVTRLHQAARCAVGGSLRSRSDAGSAEEAETMVDRAVSVEVAVGSGDVSLTPVASAKTPPERNSEGACSNKMSVVGTTGLEPAISCSQSRRASHYATSRVPRRGDPRSLLQALAGAQRGTPQVFSVP